jgi:hypothetical protein
MTTRRQAVFRKTALTVFAGAGLALSISIPLIVISTGRTRGIFAGTVVCAVFAYFFWLIGWHSAVRICQNGIVVDNLLARHMIPWADLAEIGVEYGLMFRLHDGSKIGSIMYGGSVIGQLSSYPHARKVATSMRHAAEEIRAAGETASAANAPSHYLRFINFSPWPPLVILGLMEGIAALSLIVG